MGKNIRKAGAGDLETVNKLLRQVLRLHHDGRPDLFRPEGKKYTDEQLLAIFSNPLTPVFVYEEDGVVMGYVFCELQSLSANNLMPVKTLYIDELCVDVQYRGHHVGTALFEYVKAFAVAQKCHNITLHVWEKNPSARAFYEAQGMSPQYTSMELLCDDK